MTILGGWMMVKTVGSRDAGIRAFIGLLLLVLSASLESRPLIALGIGFMGIVLLGTALFRVCPLYTLLRVDTCRRTEA